MRLQLLPIIFLYISTLLLDWYIWADIRRHSGSPARRDFGRLTHRTTGRAARRAKAGSARATAFLIFAVLTLSLLTVAISLPRRDADSDLQPVMWLLFTFLSIYFAQLAYFIFSLIGWIPKIWGGRKWNTGFWIGLPVAVLTFAGMWYGALVERRDIEIVKVDIESPRLPRSFEGYTIAQISDLHVGTWGNDTTFISALVDSVNSLKPDLIVFTGDLVNRRTDEASPFLSVLSRLSAPDGVISILGNHDYGDYITWESPIAKQANMKLMEKWQRKMGWTLLNNDHLFIHRLPSDSIAVIGVENWGEPPFPTYGRLAEAYPIDKSSATHLNDKNFKLLLSHNPEHWNREVSKISNIDLTLSGHTHAMQFELKLGNYRWSPSQYKYAQWGGLYEKINDHGDPVKIYVNIGAGEVALPMRVGATPEITLFRLHCKK